MIGDVEIRVSSISIEQEAGELAVATIELLPEGVEFVARVLPKTEATIRAYRQLVEALEASSIDEMNEGLGELKELK